MQNEKDAYGNIERNIVKEIMRECYIKKIYPNENFVTYFVSTMQILIKRIILMFITYTRN